MLYSYTRLQGASGFSALLKDTSTRARIEPPTPWLEDGPTNHRPTVNPNITTRHTEPSPPPRAELNTRERLVWCPVSLPWARDKAPRRSSGSTGDRFIKRCIINPLGFIHGDSSSLPPPRLICFAKPRRCRAALLFVCVCVCVEHTVFNPRRIRG